MGKHTAQFCLPGLCSAVFRLPLKTVHDLEQAVRMVIPIRLVRFPWQNMLSVDEGHELYTALLRGDDVRFAAQTESISDLEPLRERWFSALYRHGIRDVLPFPDHRERGIVLRHLAV